MKNLLFILFTIISFSCFAQDQSIGKRNNKLTVLGRLKIDSVDYMPSASDTALVMGPGGIVVKKIISGGGGAGYDSTRYNFDSTRYINYAGGVAVDSFPVSLTYTKAGIGMYTTYDADTLVWNSSGSSFTITKTDTSFDIIKGDTTWHFTGGGSGSSIDTSLIVYKAGAQTITGDKTFAGSVIISASAGAGKILTSDAGGNATWQANPHNSLTGVTADASVGVGDGKGYTPYQFGLRYFESPFDDFTYNAIDIYKDPVDSSGEIAFHFFFFSLYGKP